METKLSFYSALPKGAMDARIRRGRRAESDALVWETESRIAECRMPAESELRQARLMNIPTRGFCVGADIEKINADSYRYSYDPEEFAPPDI